MDTETLDTDTPSVISGLGDRIRLLRTQRNMTLQDLSDLSQVSVAMLSHAERGRSTPSIKVLDRIRAAFNVPFSAFFEEIPVIESDVPVVTRHNERPLLRFDQTGLVKELLSPVRGTQMEMMVLNLQAGGHSGEEPWRRVGEKCGLVLQGSIELTIGGQNYSLSEDDAFQFDSSTPHSFRNIHKGESRIMWIILSKEVG